MQTAAVDIVILGGGIAGLWLLNRLRQQGVSAILLETGTLGGGQTHKAQGIIHGGMKYALHGVLTQEAKLMCNLPGLWQQCLRGEGEVNLAGVNVLSAEHYLWAPGKLTAKLAGFLASTALASQVKTLAREKFPPAFQHPAFKGEVFALDEIVLDVPSLLAELAHNNQDIIFKIEPLKAEDFSFTAEGQLKTLTIHHEHKTVALHAQHFVFTAGAGNEWIAERLQHAEVAMQRRPLHMVLAKLPFVSPLYAHCMGLGMRPRITITSHRMQNGQGVWYCGGLLAEEGVERSEQEQIRAAQKELHQLFPWLDFTGTEWGTVRVDRAEPLQKNGLKPENAYAKAIHNMIMAWPTKLALAPYLANDILHILENNRLQPAAFDLSALHSWPAPALAKPLWEEVFCSNAI